MSLNQLLSNLTKKEVRLIVKLARKWCVTQFGVRYKGTRVYCYFGEYGTDRGEFISGRTKKIWLYIPNNRTVHMLLDTFLHEYKHSLQPIYYHSDKDYTYSRHPYERQANNFSQKYLSACWEYVKIQLTK